MLVAKIEMWPLGDDRARKHIRTIFIANRGHVSLDGSPSNEPTGICNYATWYRDDEEVPLCPPPWIGETQDKDKPYHVKFVHRRARGASNCVSVALERLLEIEEGT